MNIHAARTLDQWFGIPVCFFLGMVKRLRQVLSRSAGAISTEPSRVLFICLGEMGCILLADPALKRIGELFPRASCYFLTFDDNRDAVLLTDGFSRDRLITIRNRGIGVLGVDILKSIRLIRALRIDTVIDLELFTRLSAIVSYASGACRRTGFSGRGMYRGNLQTHNVEYRPDVHISRNYLRLVQACARAENAPVVPEESRIRKIAVSPQQKDSMRRFLRGMNARLGEDDTLVVINMGQDDKLAVRAWPVERYGELIRRITDNLNVFLVFIGIQGYKSSVVQIDSSRCIDLVGKTTVTDVAVLFSISRAVISHDSGLLHLASRTDIYPIALFGPETPRLYAPLAESKSVIYRALPCSPCVSPYDYKRTSCRNNQCMRSISVDEVFEELTRCLNRGANRG